jgi:hypothetical protein
MDCNNIDWLINTDDSNYQLLLNHSRILTIQCRLDTRKKEYSFFEKFVYDIAKFHLNRLKIDFD